jgi:hypothetical protein
MILYITSFDTNLIELFEYGIPRLVDHLGTQPYNTTLTGNNSQNPDILYYKRHNTEDNPPRQNTEDK